MELSKVIGIGDILWAVLLALIGLHPQLFLSALILSSAVSIVVGLFLKQRQIPFAGYASLVSSILINVNHFSLIYV